LLADKSSSSLLNGAFFGEKRSKPAACGERVRETQLSDIGPAVQPPDFWRPALNAITGHHWPSLASDILHPTGACLRLRARNKVL